MREYIETNLEDTPLRTRLRNALLNEGILELPVWYFLALPVANYFMQIAGINEHSRRILDEALARSGGPEESLGSMTAPWQLAEKIGMEFFRQRGGGNMPLAFIAGTVSGYDVFRNSDELSAIFKRHSLRQRMPVHELFVYIPHAGDPPKPTVTEELLRFGAMKETDVVSAEEDLMVGDSTMIELMLQLALSGDPSSITQQARKRLHAAVQKYLSPEALNRVVI